MIKHEKEKELLGEPWADNPYRDQPEFTYSCEKRFIACAPEKKDFGKKLSVEEFEQAMMEFPHCSFIKIDIPEPKDNQEFFFQALIRMQGCYKKHVDEVKRKALERIEWEIGHGTNLFNMAIQKREKFKEEKVVKKVINLDMWTSFDDQEPEEGRAVIYANGRGASLCREYRTSKRLEYAWKDATHWIYVELPLIVEETPKYDWGKKGRKDEEGKDYD